MSSLDGIPTCDEFGYSGGKGVSISTSNKKECTPCDQKVDEHIKAGASDNSDDTTGSNCNSDIDTVVEGISKVGISNDDNTKGSSDNEGTNCINQDRTMRRVSDEKLFAHPPPKEDCGICMLPMPYASGVSEVRITYMPCCGKVLCEGCVVESEIQMEKGNMKRLCAFCRVSVNFSDKEYIKKIKQRMELNDAAAFNELGVNYRVGAMGLPKNNKKAFELWTKAAELGSARAHYSLATAYFGNGAGLDIQKGIHHLKFAAVGGHEIARHSLGVIEGRGDITGQSMKHFMIAARAGYDESLKKVGEGYKAGHVTKDEYACTLRAYQMSVDEMMKSEGRTIASKLSDEFRRERRAA